MGLIRPTLGPQQRAGSSRVHQLRFRCVGAVAFDHQTTNLVSVHAEYGATVQQSYIATEFRYRPLNIGSRIYRFFPIGKISAEA